MSAIEGVRTYRGSCHCKAIRFEADLDLHGKGTSRCNCTICSKRGWWGALVQPGTFRLLSGEDAFLRFRPSVYGDGPTCRICGLQPFGHGNIPELGGEYYSVNVRCLDGVDLTGVRVRYLDGLHDTWAQLREAPYVNPFSA